MLVTAGTVVAMPTVRAIAVAMSIVATHMISALSGLARVTIISVALD